MNNLLTAIMGRSTGSALSTDVGGRIYLDDAPEYVAFPYVVFFIVAGTPDRTFTEHYTNTLIQFSLFSDSTSGTEITTMYHDLIDLYDEYSLTVTDSTLLWIRESNLTTMVEEMTTQGGAIRVKHWSVEFEVLTSLK